LLRSKRGKKEKNQKARQEKTIHEKTENKGEKDSAGEWLKNPSRGKKKTKGRKKTRFEQESTGCVKAVVGKENWVEKENSFRAHEERRKKEKKTGT